MKTLYQTAATAVGGRNGKVTSEDGILDIEVRMPKELGGNGTGYTNPEQLFAAGYAACFDSALNLVLGQAKVKPEAPTSVKATVGIGQIEGGAFQLAVTLTVSIPGIEKDQALQLVEKAHQVCPYSNATRNNINVQLQIA